MKKIIFLPVFAALFFTGCKKSDDDSPGPTTVTNKPNVPFTGLTANNSIVFYNANATEGTATQTSITGLQASEQVLAIDYRPGTGQLYGITNQSRLYIINTTSGAATQVGTVAFTPAISGTVSGFDFNPNVDRIRVITSTGQNFRLNPETGVATTDVNVNPGTPQIAGLAYSNNYSGASSTTLFGIDLLTKSLIKFDVPNSGTYTTIGGLAATPTTGGEFDINPDGSAAIASFTFGSTNSLYQIDLGTGKATYIGNVGTPVIGIAIQTNPVAYAVSGSNLLIFNPSGTITTISKPITGMAAETVLGMDIRPATGQLYVLGSAGNLYTINTSTGAATLVSAAPVVLTGTSFGVDFNPTVDRIRVVSNTGMNIRLNPNDGSLSGTDTNLSPGTPNVSAVAYTNNYPGATTTALYAVDFTTDMLYTFTGSPNAGVLAAVGSLGVNVDAGNGFDIGGVSGKAYAVFTVGGATKLYTINLTTGAATAVADFPSGVTGFTLGNGF